MAKTFITSFLSIDTFNSSLRFNAQLFRYCEFTWGHQNSYPTCEIRPVDLLLDYRCLFRCRRMSPCQETP